MKQNDTTTMDKENKFVLSLDIGTTTIRAFIYDQTGAIRGTDNDKVSVILHFSFICLF